MATETCLDWEQLAARIEKSDVEGFSWLLGLEFTHDDEAQEAKDRIVYALRFADVHDISWPPRRS